MANFSEDYQKAISEIKNKITNPDELKFVEQKIAELSVMFMDSINKITEENSKKIAQIRLEQHIMEEKMNVLRSNLEGILSDIYDEDDDEGGFDFEIDCPYCNNRFVIDIDPDCVSQEIKCPECHNVMQLDWDPDDETIEYEDDDDDEEDSCTGHCSGCGHDCGSNVIQYPNIRKTLEDDDEDDSDEDYDDENDDDNDDDM